MSGNVCFNKNVQQKINSAIQKNVNLCDVHSNKKTYHKGTWKYFVYFIENSEKVLIV